MVVPHMEVGETGQADNGCTPRAPNPTPRSHAKTDAELQKRERALDEALEETFPASDPIAIAGGQ